MSCHDFTVPVARLRNSTRVGCSAVTPRPRSPCCAPGVWDAVDGACGVDGGCVGDGGGFWPDGVVICAGFAGGGAAGDPGGTAVSPPPGWFPGPPPRRPRPRPPDGST